MKLSLEIILGIVRHLGTAIGGALATKGYASSDEVETAIGAIVALIPICWSVWRKMRRSPDAAKAAGPMLLLFCAAFMVGGCTHLNQEAKRSMIPSNGRTNEVIEIKTTVSTLGNGKAVVEKLRASAGKTLSTGASGVQEEQTSISALGPLVELLKTVFEAGKAAK